MEEQENTNKEMIVNFDSIEVSNDPIKKAASQKLLEKGSPQKMRSQKSHKNRKSNKQLYLNEYQNDLTSSNYCYPGFLSRLGYICIPCKVCLPCCFSSCCPCKTSPLFQQSMESLGLLQQWGHFQKILEPGLHVINPISQSIVQINQQTKILEYNQVGISKDNVQFKLTVVIFYRVIDSLKLAYRLGNYDCVICLTQIATGTLRNVLGQNYLQNVIDNRALITQKFTDELNRQIQYWGLYVQVASLKQVVIDKEIQGILEAVTKTKRMSEAMLINFRAEVECGKLIKQISQIINNEASFQIRYLNMIESVIQNNKQQNVIFIKTSMNEGETEVIKVKSSTRNN